MENVLDNYADGTEEGRLAEEVAALWGEHVRVAGARKSTTAELRLLRARLAERLYEMKALLCQPGRGGQWRGWLSTVGIPRSTGDRLVERHAELLGVATENVLTGAISTAAEVEKLIKAAVPRLRRVLSTPQMAYQYVVGVIKEFDLSCEATEGGVILRQPNAWQKPSPVGEPCGSEDGAVEDGDEVPSEVGFNTPPVTLGGEMASQ